MTRALHLLFLTIVLAVNPLSGHSTVVDSLKGLLDRDLKKEERLEILFGLTENLWRVDQEEAIKYAEETRALAEELGDIETQAFALKYKGNAYYFKADFTKVLSNWDQSLALFESIEHTQGISNLLNNMGAVYYSKGDDVKALEYYFESLRLAEEINDQTRVATALMNIGSVYSNDENTYDQALTNLNSSLSIMKTLGDQSGIGTTALNLGQVYLERKEYKEALRYFKTALEALRISGGNVPTALNLIGSTYTKMGEYDKALEYFRDASATSEELEAKLEMAQSRVYKSELYLDQKKFFDAIRVAREAEVIARELDAKKELREVYDILSKAYAGADNYQKAYEAHLKYNAIKDTIQDEAYDEKIGNLRFQFQVEKKDQEIQLLSKENEVKEATLQRNRTFRNFMFVVGGLLIFIIGGISYQYQYVKRSRNVIAEERNKSREILLNILPQETADELSDKGYVEAKKFENTTVLFTDFKSFTSYAEKTPAEDLVKSLDFYFRKFDEITSKHNLEKIKTIGDAYMCAGGLPIPNDTHPEDAVRAALEMVAFVKDEMKNPTPGIHAFETRIGINSGAVVAGVVGTKKFQYDIWGNTVNIASRMESGGEPGKVNISHNIYERIKDKFICTYRGEFEVKNAGKQKMYFVEREKEPQELDRPMKAAETTT